MDIHVLYIFIEENSELHSVPGQSSRIRPISAPEGTVTSLGNDPDVIHPRTNPGPAELPDAAFGHPVRIPEKESVGSDRTHSRTAERGRGVVDFSDRRKRREDAKRRRAGRTTPPL
ncbi:hypothetical protein NDU88_001928 [Pleurodeles waltl]|uniref:Uncharacterized protein n=1 Tax=Pleurodeles waltl TaxID=8319 RepID=A0AAV7UVQ1_PLEWA|nr:hypothetical protein NDU88_001928 [Pleurodeles waltl]